MERLDLFVMLSAHSSFIVFEDREETKKKKVSLNSVLG